MRIAEPIATAQQIVGEHFPECLAAFLAKGVLSSTRTPTSDLDIVVILEGPPAPYRETIRAHGWIVEMFIHTMESLRSFYDADAASRSFTLASICADGYVLVGDHHQTTALQEDAQRVIDQGPPALTDEERARWRYALTDLLDDFRGSTNPDESVFIACRLLQEAGELALVSDGRWTGTGKWLVRHLDAMPGGLAWQLSDGLRAFLETGEKSPLVDTVSAILDDTGGPLMEGYVARKTIL
jgi:hypothetical protein